MVYCFYLSSPDFFYHFTHTHTYIRVSVDTRASTISYHKPDDEEGGETKVKRQS